MFSKLYQLIKNSLDLSLWFTTIYQKNKFANIYYFFPFLSRKSQLNIFYIKDTFPFVFQKIQSWTKEILDHFGFQIKMDSPT
jgi:hypothetical protein